MCDKQKHYDYCSLVFASQAAFRMLKAVVPALDIDHWKHISQRQFPVFSCTCVTVQLWIIWTREDKHFHLPEFVCKSLIGTGFCHCPDVLCGWELCWWSWREKQLSGGLHQQLKRVALLQSSIKEWNTKYFLRFFFCFTKTVINSCSEVTCFTNKWALKQMCYLSKFELAAAACMNISRNTADGHKITSCM